jgi:hypothetical protein
MSAQALELVLSRSGNVNEDPGESLCQQKVGSARGQLLPGFAYPFFLSLARLLLFLRLANSLLFEFVSQQVLAALEPAALELSLTATERLEQERNELDRLWQQRRERAAYEVERAARQYHAIEPEHRLVARTLEHTWEEKLTAQQQLEEEEYRFVQQKPRLLSEVVREAIRRLATDIPALWAAPTTKAADRKEIIR